MGFYWDLGCGWLSWSLGRTFGDTMLRLKKTPFSFLVNQTRLFPSSSSFTSTTTKPRSQFQESQNLNRKTHKSLLPLLLKHPPERKTVQQIHSHLIATGGVLQETNIQLWNHVFKCYSNSDFPEESLVLYKTLCSFSRLDFDSFSYLLLIKACANIDSTRSGFQFHALMFKLGYEDHVYVQTALVNLYGFCGVLNEAIKVFDDMSVRNSVSWNVMISGLCKWGKLRDARRLFDMMSVKTVVSWTVMIDGYTRINEPSVAMGLFRQMVVDEHIRPNEITVLAMFPAISNIGDLCHCQCIHTYVEKNGFSVVDMRVANSLVDSYAKCGCIMSASRFFHDIQGNRKNLVTWTSIISALAMHGMAREAVEHFESMVKASFKPNRVTFLSILNACSHAGLVDEGVLFFRKMVDEFHVLPDIKHYGCLLDMLGRAGRLQEAENMAGEVPCEITNVVIWRTLLGACNHHGNVDMGERVTRKILEIEKKAYGGDFVLMSNIFASTGRFNDAETVRRLMDEKNASKVPGISSM